MLRGLAASRGVYEGSGAPHLRSHGVRSDRQGRRPRDRVDDRGLQHPAAAARGDRDRQRRPALALGDRRAGVRHPGRRRDARGDRAHRRRDARARRRRRRRGDGARSERGRRTRPRRATPRSSARRRSGSGRPRATVSRCRRASRSRARSSRPSPPGTSRRSRRSPSWCGRWRARSRCARRPSTRTAPTRASPASTSRCSTSRRGGADGGGERDLVVGELGLGDHLPPARRPLHAPERRRRRPGAARPRRRGRDVHPEPDDRRRRAGDRGELGARRGGRRRARDPGHTTASTARARCSSARRASRRSRSAPLPEGGTVEEDGPGRARRAALPRRRPARELDRARRTAARRSTARARDIEWAIAGGTLYLLQCRAVTRSRACPHRRLMADDGAPVEALQRVPLFAALRPAGGRDRSRACSRSAASPQARPSSRRARAAPPSS